VNHPASEEQKVAGDRTRWNDNATEEQGEKGRQLAENQEQQSGDTVADCQPAIVLVFRESGQRQVPEIRLVRVQCARTSESHRRGIEKNMIEARLSISRFIVSSGCKSRNTTTGPRLFPAGVHWKYVQPVRDAHVVGDERARGPHQYAERTSWFWSVSSKKFSRRFLLRSEWKTTVPSDLMTAKLEAMRQDGIEYRYRRVTREAQNTSLDPRYFSGHNVPVHVEQLPKMVMFSPVLGDTQTYALTGAEVGDPG